MLGFRSCPISAGSGRPLAPWTTTLAPALGVIPPPMYWGTSIYDVQIEKKMNVRARVHRKMKKNILTSQMINSLDCSTLIIRLSPSLGPVIALKLLPPIGSWLLRAVLKVKQFPYDGSFEMRNLLRMKRNVLR